MTDEITFHDDLIKQIDDFRVDLDAREADHQSKLEALRRQLDGQVESLSSHITTNANNVARGTQFILARSCPRGWRSLGSVGVIMGNNNIYENPRSSSLQGVVKIPIKVGGRFSDDWTWIHPRLCQAN